MAAPNISIIITAHREGYLAGITAQSALSAQRMAESEGITSEFILVLDSADVLTKEVLARALPGATKVLESNFGDPGLARNFGVKAALGKCATFLDADDLWSENWLCEAWQLSNARPDAALHSACNLVFGTRRMLFWHVDSEAAICDTSYLNWLNYWDAMSFAQTELYRRFPFKANDLALGFGHEDWHWNAWTIQQGVPHKPVPGTMHFKRARTGSQMSRVEKADGVRWPLGGDAEWGSFNRKVRYSVPASSRSA